MPSNGLLTMKGTRRLRGLFGPAVASASIVLLLVACGSTKPSSSAAIEGLFQAAGGKYGFHSVESGVVDVIGKRHVYIVYVGKTGRFRVSVPPGSYRVRGRTPSYQDDRVWCPGRAVTARPGDTSHTVVQCNLI